MCDKSRAEFRLTLWQWYKFLLVSRHYIETARLPLLFRLLDAFARRGDEVPPDVTLGGQRGAAEQHEMRALASLDDDLVARPEDQQPVGRKAVAGDGDVAV